MPGPGPGFSWSEVRGQAVCLIGLGAGTPLFLGVAAESPRFQFSPMELPIPSDVAGPSGYSDVQDMGEIAHISATLTAIDATVLDQMIAWRKGSVDGPGAATPRGTPINADSRSIRVMFDFENQPIRFLTCRLMSPLALTAGTKYSTYQFEWEAWSPPSVDSSGLVEFEDLYDSTIA